MCTHYIGFAIWRANLLVTSCWNVGNEWRSNGELFPAWSTAPPCRMEQHMSVALAHDQSGRQGTSAGDSPLPYNSLSFHRVGQEDG